MKIHRISFTNINSLRGSHTVHFEEEPLKNAGLFAITGPTGAGKTTLLDVISLALYNHIPRIDRAISKKVIEEQGIILTENTTEAAAEVEYTSRAGRYTSRWTISKARTGNLKDYHMEIWDHHAQQLLDLKKSVVPAHNETLIGLNYEQFIRSMLLAQGEFAKFLKTDKKERGALLERITGTEIYRRIGQRAYDKNKEYGQELERLLDQESELAAKQLAEADFEGLEVALAQANTALAQVREQKQQLDTQIRDKRRYMELAQGISSLETELLKAQADQEAFEAEAAPRLKRHEALLPHEEALRHWQEARKGHQSLQAQEGKWQAGVQTGESQWAEAVAALRACVGSATPEEELLSALADLEARVGTLDDERKEARHSFKVLSDQVKPLAQRLHLDLTLNNPAESRGKALERQKTLQVAHVKAAGLVPVEWVEDLALGQEEWQRQQERLLTWKHLESELAKIAGQQATLSPRQQQLATQIEHVPAQVATQQQRLGRLEAEYEGLKKDVAIAQLQAQVEDLRPKLVGGEPCPLCGATHHPYAVQAPHSPGADLETQLAHKEQEVRQAERELITLQQSLERLAQEQAQVQADVLRLHQEQQAAEEKRATLRAAWEEAEQPESPEALSRQLEDQQGALKTLRTTQAQMEDLQVLERTLAQMVTVVQDGKRLSEQIADLYAGQDIRQEAQTLRSQYERATLQLAKAREDLHAWRTELAQAQTHLQQQEQDLAQPLKALGYATAEAACADLLSAAEFGALARQANALGSAITTLTHKLQDRQEQLNQQNPELAAATMEGLQHQLQQATQRLNEQQAQRDLQHTQHADQLRIRRERSALTERIASQREANEQWLLLKQYIGDAKGEKFSTFAQDLTLHHLVAMANRRLQHLTQRYRLQPPALDGSGDDSLSVIDLDMGEMRRSVKTLSGGESFLISLALALGLSDLASQEVDIQSLFIDEGFGTLDPETLDLTLDTLERLQAEGGKTIGVISHVEALKERIATQIIVQPNGQGHSTVKTQG